MANLVRTPRIFYGWYIVAASFIILFFSSGSRYAFGVMFKPIIQEFGWSRGSISLVFFLNMVVFSLAIMIAGKAYDRRGPRMVLTVSTLFVSAGFILTAFIHSIGEFFFSYGILAALGVAGTSVPTISTITSKWFEKRRGLALSLAVSGVSIGQFVLVPFFSLLTAGYGWRATYLYGGILMLVINLSITWFVVKGDPHQMGLNPLGSDVVTRPPALKATQSSPLRAEKDFTLTQAMRTRSFWLMSAAMFICGSGDYFATTHLIPMATDLGISPLTAGNMLGLYGLMSLAGILAAGPAADRIGNKIPIVFQFLLRVLLCLMVLEYKSVTSLWVFAMLYGFTHLITAPLIPMLMLKLYGGAHLGTIAGFVNTAHFLGGGVWAYGAGVVFDKTGSYQLAFAVSAAVALAAAILGLLIRERRHVILESGVSPAACL